VAQDQPVYLVGGPVRDQLLGREATDLDLTTEGDALRLADELAERLGAELISHPRFGTCTLRLPEGEIDLATARTEVYPRPGSLPVVQPGTLQQDLWRRDFTFNALAQRITSNGLGETIDVCTGVADLRAGKVRVLHPGSFLDDPTRLFRAVRFEQRLGFRIEPETERWFAEALEGGAIDSVSSERIGAELRLCFQEAKPVPVVRRLQQLGLLTALGFPSRWSVRRQRFLEEVPPGDWQEALTFELPSEQRALLGKKLFAGSWAATLAALHSHPSNSSLYRLLHPLTPQALRTLTARLRSLPTEIRHLQHYCEHLQAARPLLRGDDLKQRGFSPGPAFKQILDEAFVLQLDRGWNDRQPALEWLAIRP
jgi:tRNA nucleotidyltransferase (CCA-adding enzyme)